MTSVVLDTHTTLWWSFLPDKLSETAAAAIAEAEQLLIPAIVSWEVALLVRKQRFALPVPPKRWLRELRSIARVKMTALTADVALLADSLAMHDDPADRFIVATALKKRCPLVTRDAAIRGSGLVPTIW